MNFNKVLALVIAGAFFSFKAKAQDEGRLSGNFQMDAQYYFIDSLIGAPVVPEKVLMNGFANINYVKGNFRAGLRYESYLNTIQGFPEGYRGNGVPFRYAGYTKDELDVTVGNFYEQFGSGLILRAYEERALGLDNAFDGIRVKYEAAPGVNLTGLIAKQRLFFTTGPGIVRAANADVFLNELLGRTDSKNLWTIGLSGVSKYQADNDPRYNLPENVFSYSARLGWINGNLSASAEYVHKYNDPSGDNGFAFQEGRAVMLNLGYSKKGLGVNLAFKSLDNLSFRSDRGESLNNLLINYVPALTKQHTYNLAATLYPYAAQPRGEFSYLAEVFYKVPRKSTLGGKYGMDIYVNYAQTLEPYREETSQQVQDEERVTYTNNIFKPGKEIYFQDFNIEIKKKLSKKHKLTASYIYLTYNNDISLGVIESEKEFIPKGLIRAHIGVLDFTQKINRKHSLRYEVQHLSTDQHRRNWATAVIEYTYSPHWFVAVMDQYNYGNPIESQKLHYFYGSVGYIKGANRISLGYGRQRAGVFCIGGVCRQVPASNGFTLSITSTF